MEPSLIAQVRSDRVRKQLFARVEKTDECWNWQGSVHTRWGHGQIKVGGKTLQTHRVRFIMHGGDPDAEVVRHTCDNPNCVNPAHLLEGTHADNVADRVARGRSAVGEGNGRSKLKASDIPEIQRMLCEGHSTPTIARLYRVDAKVIRDIRGGKTWRSVAEMSVPQEMAMAA